MKASEKEVALHADIVTCLTIIMEKDELEYYRNEKENDAYLVVLEKIADYDDSLEDGLLDSIDHECKTQFDKLIEKVELNKKRMNTLRSSIVTYAELIHKMQVDLPSYTPQEILKLLEVEIRLIGVQILDQKMMTESLEARINAMNCDNMIILLDKKKDLKKQAKIATDQYISLRYRDSILDAMLDIVNKLINKGDK